jgi:hypothetical protein
MVTGSNWHTCPVCERYGFSDEVRAALHELLEQPHDDDDAERDRAS